MAGLEVRNGRYNIILRFGGKRFVRSLKTSDEDVALRKKLRLEENVALVESGRLTIPDGSDVMTFLLSDGKLNKKPVINSSLTIPQLFAEFWDAMPEGNLEDTTIDMMKIHQRHLERLMGKRIIAQEITQGDLQKYVTKRSKEKTYKGTTITGVTINIREMFWAIEIGDTVFALDKSLAVEGSVSPILKLQVLDEAGMADHTLNRRCDRHTMRVWLVSGQLTSELSIAISNSRDFKLDRCGRNRVRQCRYESSRAYGYFYRLLDSSQPRQHNSKHGVA